MRLMIVPDGDRLPPCGRYMYQNVLLPPGRIRRPKPGMPPRSQSMIWPFFGARTRAARFSVSFLAIRASSIRQHIDSIYRHISYVARYGALWRDMAINQGEPGGVPCFIWRGMEAQGAEIALGKGEVVSSILTGSTTKKPIS